MCFLAIALPASTLVAFLTPPFQNPDEIAHVLRADQVARGGWRGERVSCASAADPVLCRISDEVAFGLVGDQPTLGGKVDLGLLRLAAIYRSLPFNPDRTSTRTMDEAARVVGFDQMPHLAAFTNTAVYSPLLYLPAAAAITAARSLGLTPLNALRLARIINLLVTLGVATLALGLCLRGAQHGGPAGPPHESSPVRFGGARRHDACCGGTWGCDLFQGDATAIGSVVV